MQNENGPYKVYLEESEMPRRWYNLRADMKEKPAPLSSLRMIREKDLNKHLEKTDGDKGKASGKKVETPAPAANEPLPDAKEFLERDNQLRMSLQFVKSLPKIRTIH